ncbi:MAG: PAS domain-containing protein, partial [Acidobacteria bacterium]|nr:PAS domain-containing protein [Acidobacteriota bacterium]
MPMQRTRLISQFLVVSSIAAAVVLLMAYVLDRQMADPALDVSRVRILTWIFSVIAISLIVGAAMVQDRLVSRRIQRVLEGMKEIRKGMYPRLVVSGSDEVSQLMRDFNQTVEEIRGRDEKLTSWAGKRESEFLRLSRSLDEEREKLGTVLDSIGDGVIVLDAENKVLMANQRVSEVFGVPLESLTRADLGRLVEQVRHRLVHPDQVEQKLREMDRDPGLVDEITLELDEPGGQAIRLYCAPVKGPDGKVLGRIATSLDLGR